MPGDGPLAQLVERHVYTVDVIGSSPVGPTGRGGTIVSETELIAVWNRARRDLILSQLAPTALLGFSILLMILGLADADLAVRFAAAGILLASGVLGAVAQYSAASEAQAAGRELSSAEASVVGGRIAASARWLWIVKFVTPAIFVLIFGVLLVALFL
jgi:hypothetical protein